MSQPDTSDELKTEIRKLFEKHTIPEFDPELTMFDIDEVINDITAHINQAVLQAKLDELENNRSMMTNIGMVSPIEFAKYLRDRIATLTKQLEQEQPK